MQGPRILGILTLVLFTSTAGIHAAGKKAGNDSNDEKKKAGNGLAMTDEQIRARLRAMNERAATRPADPAAEDAGVRARREAKARSERFKADWELADYRKKQQMIDAAVEELAQIGQELPKVQRAEAEMNEILRRLDLDRLVAEDAGTSYFKGEIRDPFSRMPLGSFEGEVRNASGGLAAVMAVEARYGPELRESRKQVSSLYERYTALRERQAQLTAFVQESGKQQNYTRIRYEEAVKKAKVAGAANARPTTRPAATGN